MKNLITIIGITIAVTFLNGCKYKSKAQLEYEERLEAERKEAEFEAECRKKEIENLNELLLTPTKHDTRLNFK